MKEMLNLWKWTNPLEQHFVWSEIQDTHRYDNTSQLESDTPNVTNNAEPKKGEINSILNGVEDGINNAGSEPPSVLQLDGTFTIEKLQARNEEVQVKSAKEQHSIIVIGHEYHDEEVRWSDTVSKIPPLASNQTIMSSETHKRIETVEHGKLEKHASVTPLFKKRRLQTIAYTTSTPISELNYVCARFEAHHVTFAKCYNHFNI